MRDERDGAPEIRIAFILRSYPRLSQTFILNEILALERLGLRISIFGTTNPHERITQDGVTDVRAPTQYLEPASRRSRAAILLDQIAAAAASPRRYLSTLAYVLRRADLDAGYAVSSRFSCFLQAVYLARLLRRENARGATRFSQVHSHFAHDPTLIALLVHRLTGIPFSFTAHARDLYQLAPAALAERVRAASTVVTCSRSNLDYLSEVAPEARAKLSLVHHGIDLDSFRPPGRGRSLAEVPLIVSVGRLVEKKGFPDLIAACRMLKESGHRFRCLVFGEGPLEAELTGAVEQLGLRGVVKFEGARTQRELLAAFQHADLFALTPFVTDDGDRDGIPNAMLEAMACGLPVVSTAVGGIPEVVVHDQNGLLARPHDVASIAEHLADLLTDAPRRAAFGLRARNAVVAGFDVETNARRLAGLLDRRFATSWA